MKCRNSDFRVELKYLELEDFLELAQALGVPLVDLKNKPKGNDKKYSIKDIRDFEEIERDMLRAFDNLSQSLQKKLIKGLRNSRYQDLNLFD